MNILFFVPHAYYSVHSLPESLVAESLKIRGNKILFVYCNGIYSKYCICMSAISPSSPYKEKESICKVCKFNRDSIVNEFGFDKVYIEEYISEEDHLLVETEVSRLMPETYYNYIYKGIPLGRYALYEFLLNRKKNSNILNEDEFEEYKIHFSNSLITLLAGNRIFEKNSIDRVVTYNSLYSVNHMICALADKYNIPHFTLHAGRHHKYRISEMTIFKGLISPTIINRHSTWKFYQHKPLSKQKIERVAVHIKELLQAKSPWVYSIKSQKLTEENLRKYFGIKSEQKVILAMMASADEKFAADVVDASPSFKPPLFKTQIEWINYLLDFVKDRPEYFLIIRVHPRDFPNKRESVLSAQALILQKNFTNLPNNVAANFPKDSISLHDLIKITDVGLNATSTSGLELLFFGVPVVIYDKHQFFSYARELNLIGETTSEYENRINEAIATGYSLDNVIGAYRWMSYVSDLISINIDDGYKSQLSIVERIIRSISVKFNLYFKNYYFLYPIKNRKIPLKNAELLAAAIENDLTSHLEQHQFIIDNCDSEDDERKIIKTYLYKYSKMISDNKSESQFLRRIKAIIK